MASAVIDDWFRGIERNGIALHAARTFHFSDTCSPVGAQNVRSAVLVSFSERDRVGLYGPYARPHMDTSGRGAVNKKIQKFFRYDLPMLRYRNPATYKSSYFEDRARSRFEFSRSMPPNRPSACGVCRVDHRANTPAQLRRRQHVPTISRLPRVDVRYIRLPKS